MSGLVSQGAFDELRAIPDPQPLLLVMDYNVVTVAVFAHADLLPGKGDYSLGSHPPCEPLWCLPDFIKCRQCSQH